MDYSWQLFHYQLPMNRPLVLIGGQHRQREGLLLRLEDVVGNVGWGEIAPLPGLHRESLATCHEQLLAVLSHKPLPQRLPSLAPTVQFGLDMAQRMLQAQRDHSTPQDFIRPHVPKLPVNGLVTHDEHDIATACKRLRASGFRAVKIKVGQGVVDEAIARVRAARHHLGPGVELRIDANRAWSWEHACRFAQATQDVAIAYCEEPLHNSEHVTALNQATGLPLALDETLWQQPKWLTKPIPGLRALILKPTLLGSWETAAHWVRFAKRNRLQVVFSSTFETGLGTFWIAMMALASSAHRVPCGLDTYCRLAEDVLTEPLAFHNGHVYLPQEWPKVHTCRLDKEQEGYTELNHKSRDAIEPYGSAH